MEERNIVVASASELEQASYCSFNSSEPEMQSNPYWKIERSIGSWDKDEGLDNFFIPNTLQNAKLIYAKKYCLLLASNSHLAFFWVSFLSRSLSSFLLLFPFKNDEFISLFLKLCTLFLNFPSTSSKTAN